jgi:ATP-dependent DNA helicase RecG
MLPDEAPSASPEDPAVESLDGVGPRRARALHAAGLPTLSAILRRLPRSYTVFPAPQEIASLARTSPGEVATVVGTVASKRHRRSRRTRGGHLTVELEDESGRVEVTLFNQGFLREKIAAGDRLRVTLRLGRNGAEHAASDHRILKDDDAGNEVEVRPRHPALDGVPPRTYARWVEEALERFLPAMEEPLPEFLVQRRGLPSLEQAIRAGHFPRSLEDARAAEERFLYHGFLAAALRVAGARADREDGSSSGLALRIDWDEEADRELRACFPFELTSGQDAAYRAIREDLAAARPMRRMLQGDVGSGKTAVAVLAALGVARAGSQAAVLVPTETLARQFHRELAHAGAAFGLEAAFLSGGLPRAERRRVEEGLAKGAIPLVVGTHAVLGPKTQFRRLALAVVDEQHRFGVLQRLRLVRKAEEPNLLAMSATPIPRSLALTLFADLDHSEIRERPPGRKPVVTQHHVTERDGKFDWGGLAKLIEGGAKAFIVFPAIESESESIPSLFREGRALARRYFRGVALAAIHGRMSDDEKAESLDRFRRGEVKLLFATTVIEVGVDVPDAALILILGASRFGLAQLHQLRGRVGRGGLEGHCLLLTKTAASADSERLRTLVECDDGFAIAERDLEIRGPGDLMGLKQHGMMAPRPGGEDEVLFLAAFEDARELLAQGLDVGALAQRLETWSRRPRPRGPELQGAG